MPLQSIREIVERARYDSKGVYRARQVLITAEAEALELRLLEVGLVPALRDW